MIKITVFTPTHNRAHTLGRLYQSLVRQTSKDFVWLIVDDGSTDNTESLVTSFTTQNIIEIKYVKQQNMGKHAAHNAATLIADTELFVCVDSDDSLVEKAIEEIISIWEMHDNNEKVCGIIGPRSIVGSNSMRTWPKNKKYVKLGMLYEKYKFTGETVIVFRSDIIKQYLFPIFKGEKFVTESIIYQRIDEHYYYIFTDKVLYISEYLPDGLSSKIEEIMMKSPKGTALHYKQTSAMSTKFIIRLKSYACYLAIKKVFNLDDILIQGSVHPFIRSVSKIFVSHYIRLFTNNIIHSKES